MDDLVGFVMVGIIIVNVFTGQKPLWYPLVAAKKQPQKASIFGGNFGINPLTPEAPWLTPWATIPLSSTAPSGTVVA